VSSPPSFGAGQGDELLAVPKRVDAEAASAQDGEREKHETVQRRQLTAVQRRIESLRRVREEVRKRHQPRENERDWTREEPDREQQPADDLERAGEPHLRHRRGGAAERLAGREQQPEMLLHAMLNQHETGNEAQRADDDMRQRFAPNENGQ
jgi:hypothetical protein